jgi:hypothetical protein
MSEATAPLPNTLSWRGALLSTGTTSHLHLFISSIVSNVSTEHSVSYIYVPYLSPGFVLVSIKRQSPIVTLQAK